ncbi:uncharacterized protein LOC143460019 [Clavelina lepadiformis]|uniref:uncharacterized protein LOC143460019 n=1 Tax=Clavelina lepadiformis TaxID=159417 RepID=UPI0040416A04
MNSFLICALLICCNGLASHAQYEYNYYGQYSSYGGGSQPSGGNQVSNQQNTGGGSQPSDGNQVSNQQNTGGGSQPSGGNQVSSQQNTGGGSQPSGGNQVSSQQNTGGGSQPSGGNQVSNQQNTGGGSQLGFGQNSGLNPSPVQQRPTTNCRNCVDKSALYCRLFAGRCNKNSRWSLGIQLSCSKTCGLCTPCVSSRSLSISQSNCEIDCRDEWPAAYCFIFKGRNQCAFVSTKCKKTCSLCTECVLPPTAPPCSDDCKDNHAACPSWRDQGYCRSELGFPHTITVCPLSCRSCTRCPESNTALPPLPPSFQQTTETPR